MNKHHKDITAKKLRKIVKTTPHGCQPDKFELKEGRPLMIRAKWGHTIPV